MALTDVMARIAGYLRAGYPLAARASGHLSLLALLPRRLTDSEITSVAAELAAYGDRPMDLTDIRVAITKITDGLPAADDIDRIATYVRARGWPIGDDFTDGSSDVLS